MIQTTLRSRMSPADLCLANGWGPGTRLAGDEGYGVTVIRITAVGEGAILARRESHDGHAFVSRHESTWTLDARDWREVTE